MVAGGKWDLQAGQWTDDTSTALCLASSLIAEKGFNPYDQWVRYKWWYNHGYISSNGRCFDIGSATRMALDHFIQSQKNLQIQLHLRTEFQTDHLPLNILQKVRFNVDVSRVDAKGNGALARIAPIALFYYRNPRRAVELAGESARLTHAHQTAIDVCQDYTALIIGTIHGVSKKDLLDEEKFLNDKRDWFEEGPLHPEIRRVIQGSYKDLRFREGLRQYRGIFLEHRFVWQRCTRSVKSRFGYGYCCIDLWSISGAYYGPNQIPQHWKQQLYAYQSIDCVAQWLQVLNSGRIMTDGKAHHTAFAKHFLHPNTQLHKQMT